MNFWSLTLSTQSQKSKYNPTTAKDGGSAEQTEKRRYLPGAHLSAQHHSQQRQRFGVATLMHCPSYRAAKWELSNSLHCCLEQQLSQS